MKKEQIRYEQVAFFYKEEQRKSGKQYTNR